MLLKKIIILLIIIVSLLAAFWGTKYFQQKIRPRESLARLSLFIVSCLLLIFILTFMMVLIITRLFPGELIK